MDIFEKAEKLGITIPPITAEEINVQIKPVLSKMEEAGIRLDTDVLKKLCQKLSDRVAELRGAICQAAGTEFNVDSPSQMADILFDKIKLSTAGLKKTKNGFSTAASELRKIEHEHKIVPLILENRELSKLISTYLKPLPLLVDADSRLHTTYGLETTTGRLSSSEPNLQNVPIRGTYGADIRAAFVASEGMKLISADYSQIELRVVACLAQDKAMIAAFHARTDIHTRTASEIFEISPDKVTPEQRRVAKTVNFGIVYGQTPYGLAQGLGISVEKAGEYITHYFEIHKGIKNYINEMITMAHTEGYVETLFGTRRYLPNINSHIRQIAEAEERMAINMPVQGTAAEILKLAMIQLDRKLSNYQLPITNQVPITQQKNSKKNGNFEIDKLNGNWKLEIGKFSQMLLTVHDEIVVEAPADQAEEVAKIVKDTMENVVTLCLPVEVNVSIGDNWAEAK